MTNWMSGVCKANGINIHYLRTGGCKPPLVLLHGLTGSGACWIPLARAFGGEYDVVMPDARGHGNSSTPVNGYRYQDHASDVAGLIQGLGLAAPVLLGHSMGGMTAAVVASQIATAIRGVILADPTFLSSQHQREVHESDVVEQHRRGIRVDDEAKAVVNSLGAELLASATACCPATSARSVPSLICKINASLSKVYLI